MTSSPTLWCPTISTGPKWASVPGSAVNTTAASRPLAPSVSEVATLAYGYPCSRSSSTASSSVAIDLLTIARRADRERRPLSEVRQPIRRQDVETDEVDRAHADGGAFVDRQRHVDGVLLVVELHVEGGDACVRVPAVSVERRDALEIRVEAGVVEALLAPPGQPRALPRGKRRPETRLVDGGHADKGQPPHGDGPVFPTGRRGRDDEDDEKEPERLQAGPPDAHGHPEKHIPCATRWDAKKSVLFLNDAPGR